MRISVIALLASLACSNCAARSRGGNRPVNEEDGGNPRARPNVAGARELDREGVRNFRDGRYADAARYFRMAYRLGGPSSELWNVARTLERLDDPEGADHAIDEYLQQRDLSPQDRAEAEREARALRARPSTLSITTTPAAAVVTLDGKQAVGPTPLSVEVSAGPHTIAVRLDGYAAETRTFDARYGRAVIVSLDLSHSGK